MKTSYFNVRYFTFRDVAEILLEDKRWKQMLMSFDTEFTTPLRGLIVVMPGKQ